AAPRERGIEERQVDGLVVVVLVTAAVCLLSFFSTRIAYQDAGIAHGDPRDGAAAPGERIPPKYRGLGRRS
ncbi:MAG: hypothetical protein WCK90_06505, partial [archaeon]